MNLDKYKGDSKGWILLFKIASFYVVLFAMLGNMTACATLPKVESRSVRQSSYAYPSPESSLSRAYARQIQAHPEKSGFMLLGSGLDAFVTRIELVKKAERSIDVQYFIVWDDLVGKLFYQALLEAANRGVRVRILLDDAPLKKMSSRLARLDTHPKIEVRAFNPLNRTTPRFIQYIFRSDKYSHRMHNKVIIFDNSLSIVGSRNIGNKYAGARSSHTDIIFSGLDVVTIGPVTGEISDSFDQYWNNQHSVRLSNLSRPADMGLDEIVKDGEGPVEKRFRLFVATSALVPRIREDRLRFEWGKAVVIADSPDKVTQKIEPGHYLDATSLKPFISATTEELLIVSPYIIPNGAEGINFFRKLRDRGIKVTILTNSYASTDNKIVSARYARYRKALLELGVGLYEFKASGIGALCCVADERLFSKAFRPGLHAKILIFDGKQAYIGAMNIDPRSIYENTEMGVVISSPGLSSKIGNWFKGNLNEFAYRLELNDDGRLVWRDLETSATTLTDPDTGLLGRIIRNILGLLPFESNL